MALKIFEQIKRLVSGDDSKEVITTDEVPGAELWGLSSEVYVRELAFLSCVNLMGNAISKCEFKTFAAGKEIKGAEHYLWNVEPNRNQNSSTFLHKLIYQLYHDNAVLVVESGGQLLVADDYQRTEYALKDNLYTQVRVGDFVFNRSFAETDVIYLELGEQNMRQLINGLYGVYQKLIDYGMRSYRKSRGAKGVLTIDATASGDSKFQDSLAAMQNGGFKSFAEAESGVLTLYKGLEYNDIGSKTYSNEGTRDIRAMIDDVSDFTAKAFGIPPVLLSGQVAGIDDALQQFLTFAVDPLADMFQEEINRKRNGYEGFKHGNYLQIDTSTITHLDKIKFAESIDKLISSGAYCVNDIRLMMGDPIIDEPWAWQHYITKNYEDIQQATGRERR